MKMLPSGIYHFRFIVDGEWRYAPDFPHECDDMGRVFNVLDLKVLPCGPLFLIEWANVIQLWAKTILKDLIQSIN